MTLSHTKTSKSNKWLWTVLIATIALSVWTALTPEPEESLLSDSVSATLSLTDHTTTPVNTPVVNQTSTSSAGWLVRHREALAATPVNLFPVHSWHVAAPVIIAKPKVVAPPPPVAPPAPFTYMGKMEDSPKGTQIFLMANNKVYLVAKGEQIDAFWRLDGEDAHQLLFTFLPLNLPQTLSKSQKLISQVPTNTGMIHK